MPPRPTAITQLAALGIHPRKSLGQNFLVDPIHRDRIVDAARLSAPDVVLEVGPGPGVLTDLLASQAGRVLAVELDERLIPFLRQRFASQPHVSIIQGDILKLDPGRLTDGGSYKVVANLPYYITGSVLRHFLEAKPPPQLMVLTVQKEVAERMVARPPDMSLLAVSVQYYASVAVVAEIPANAFYPVPKVDSAVVRIELRAEPEARGVDEGVFFRIVKAGFCQPRKQLRNSLAAGLGVPPAQAATWLMAAGIDPHRRAETLELSEWGALARVASA